MKKTIVSAAIFCLVCIFAAPARAGSLSTQRFSVIILTSKNTVDAPLALNFSFVNSYLNDPTEFHLFCIFTVGIGTVKLTITPASLVDVQYGITGFIGLAPITGVGLYGLPIEIESAVPVVCFGMLFMTTTRTEESVVGVDYPVVMNVEASLDQTTATTTTVSDILTTTTTINDNSSTTTTK